MPNISVAADNIFSFSLFYMRDSAFYICSNMVFPQL